MKWCRATDTVPHPDHPDRPPLMSTANSAVHNAVMELYNLCVIRWDSGPERVAAYLGGFWTGSRSLGHGGEYPPYTDVSHCLDLVTGEEFWVSSLDKDVVARRIKVSDLPPALRDAWPRDDKGRSVRPGHSAERGVMDKDVLRRLATSVDAAPLQGSLF